MGVFEELYFTGVSVQAATALLLAVLLVHFHRRDGGGHLGWWAAALVALALFDVSVATTSAAGLAADAGDGLSVFASLLAQTAGYCAAACVAIGALELLRGRPAVGAGLAAGLPLLLLVLGATTTFSTVDADAPERRFVRIGLLALAQAAAFGAAAFAHVRRPAAAPRARALATTMVLLLAAGRVLVIASEATGTPADPANEDGGVPLAAFLPFVDLWLLLGWTLGVVLEEVARLRLSLDEARESAQRHASKTRDSQHLEAIGRLVGSVAHDYNNLLTALTGYSRLLVQRLPEESREHAFAVEIREASERAIELTSQLQAFSRRHQRFRPTVLSLNEHLRSFERILRRLLGDDVTLEIDEGDRDLRVRADPGQLEQLLLQLASNARESMPEGGVLRISTRQHHERSDADEPVSGLAPGRYALLSVADTGHGFDRAVGERIFEPFFTTHAADGASGLGLATVRGVVKQCGGAIDVDSEPGRGTEFRIYLPLVAAEEATARPVTTEPPSSPGSGRVLVVEDEKSILFLVELALREAGYHVSTASGAAAAEEAFERDGGRFDVLVTDLVMPGLSGRELADRLLARAPDLRVVFMTGVPRGGPKDGATTFGGDVEVLRKPFSAERVVERVEEALARPSRVT